MEILYWLEGIRNPVCDALMLFVSKMGEESLFIAVALFFLWCVNKWDGYYMLSTCCFGILINQFLKLWFRIPRPWVRDPDFTIVEAARAEATGYSFPSGHTQNATDLYGSIAVTGRNKIVRGIAIALVLLMPLSRMYLGVHTPADVGVSLLVGLALVVSLHFAFRAIRKAPHRMFYLLGVLLACNVALLLFLHLYPFPATVYADPEQAEKLASGVKNGYTMLGCIAAMGMAYFVDMRYTRYETKAVWWVQIIKVAGGLIPLLVLKELLKAPLNLLCGGLPVAHALRYFIAVGGVATLWPACFGRLARLGQGEKKQNAERE